MSRRILFALLAATGLVASVSDSADARTTRRYCSSCQRSVQKVYLPVIQTEDGPAAPATEAEPAAPTAEAQPVEPATEAQPAAPATEAPAPAAPAAEAAPESQPQATSSTTSGNTYRRYTSRFRRFRLRG